MNKKFLISSILIGMTLLVYSQVHNFKFIYFDDGGYVFNNPNVHVPISLKSIFWAFTTTQVANWHPLTWLSHMLDFQLYGMNAGGHHLTSLFIHLANTVLLFLVLEKMTGGLWQSALVAALFALHPLHVESVAWISERKDVLSALFWILTLRAYLYYVEHPVILRYLLVLLTFLLGLMAKPMLVTLPFVLLLLDFWPLARFSYEGGGDGPGGPVPPGHNRAKFFSLIFEKVPFLLLSAASSVVTFYAQQSTGAVNQILSLVSRISNALVSYIAYLGKMFWPQHLSFFYIYSMQLPIWQTVGTGLMLALISLGVFWKWNRYPYLTIGWLWYLGTLIPVIGLIQVGSQSMADRYTYIPFIGLFIMIAWGLPDLLSRFPYRKTALWLMAGIFLTVLMILSWVQVGYWKNSIVLFQHALKMNAGNYKAHDMLGFTLLEQGKLDQAMFHFREAIKRKPNYGSAYNNLGVALEKKGKLKEATAQYLEALKVQPGLSETHYNLGIIMIGQGKLETAISYFQAALRINKKYAEAYNNLGVVFLTQGRMAEAIIRFSEALRLKPFFAEAHYNLGTALSRIGRIDEAIEHFEDALKIQPKYFEAYNNLGWAQARKGKVKEAVASFQQALLIKPAFDEARKNLEKMLQRKGFER